MLFDSPSQNLLTDESLDITNKNEKLDFLHGIQNAINSFLLEINKIIPQGLFLKHFSLEYYDEIYINTILRDLCNAVTEIFYKEKSNHIINCGKKFHIKSDKLSATYILNILATMIDHKELYDE
jgi:hypothetical protein